MVKGRDKIQRSPRQQKRAGQDQDTTAAEPPAQRRLLSHEQDCCTIFRGIIKSCPAGNIFSIA